MCSFGMIWIRNCVSASKLTKGRSEVELQPTGPEFIAGFVLGGPEVNSSVTIVNSQLVCFGPVGLLNFATYNFQMFLFSSYLWATIETTGLPVLILVATTR